LQRKLRVLRVGCGEVDDVDVGSEQLVIAAVGLRDAVKPGELLGPFRRPGADGDQLGFRNVRELRGDR